MTPEVALADYGKIEVLLDLIAPGGSFLVRNELLVFRLTSTSERGFHSDRRRYRVVCCTCATLLHEATTSPRHYIEWHMKEAPHTPRSAGPLADGMAP